ncbi:hypothetical protein BDN67DRAFT_1016494 [Paxillus ammoniavirescens]|nr:hypothetical protein BDN67DRAFT_1016494 [Paxillus ammoniavirescens]
MDYDSRASMTTAKSSACLQNSKTISPSPWPSHRQTCRGLGILQTGLKSGASVRGILQMIEDALERGYQPHNHSSEALQPPLYSQPMSPNPSLHTLHNHTSFVHISPTISCISINSIIQNIQDILITPCKDGDPKPLHGVSFLIDKTAMEEEAIYLPHFNSVAGLCWTHSHFIDTTLNTYKSAL